VLFIITQQTQPAWQQAARQSQQPWIILQHSASPDVQVMHTPLGVDSHLQTHMVMLQQQTTMPFMVQQQDTMPPASMEQSCCIMPHAAASSQTQVIFIPPLHFSIFMVQRGTIVKLGAVIGMGEPMAGIPMPGTPIAGIPMLVRSIISALVM
jgi:hypothetical protein